MDNVLIIRFSSLGDVILATSVIDACRRMWPGCEITFVVKDEYAPVLENNPHLTMVLSLWPGERGLGSLYSLGRKLRGERFDLVVDLQGGPRGRALAWAVGARRTSRPHSRRLRRMLMTARPRRWRTPLPHVVERYLECLSPWAGDRVPEGSPKVWLTAGEVSTARSKLERAGEGPLVALAPGAKWPSKRWPETNYSALASALSSEGTGVLVAGSAAERALAEKVASAAGGAGSVVPYSGGIRDLAAAFSLCEALVCNDSGLMHLAAAVGTPVLGVFGPTAPHLGFAPYGGGNEVLWLGLDCSPCSLHGEKPCRIARRAPCLEEIDAGTVLSVLRPMLKPSIQGEHGRTRSAGGGA